MIYGCPIFYFEIEGGRKTISFCVTLTILTDACWSRKWETGNCDVKLTRWMKPEAANQTLMKIQESWASRILLLVRSRLRYCRMSGNDISRKALKNLKPADWNRFVGMIESGWCPWYEPINSVALGVNCYLFIFRFWNGLHAKIEKKSRAGATLTYRQVDNEIIFTYPDV